MPPRSQTSEPHPQSITEITRRAIFDWIVVSHTTWSGRLSEVDLLDRVFDLESLPSHDGRFPDMAGDIWQHRVNNPLDWSDDWYVSDSRLALLDGPDDTFLRFLCETVHPVVRDDRGECSQIVAEYNSHLKHDGWELFVSKTISGRPVYTARHTSPAHDFALRSTRRLADALDSDHLREQLRRIEQAVEDDPALAIGTAKELVETMCKAILEDRQTAYERGSDLPQLVKATTKALGLIPDAIPDSAKGAETIRVLLSNLASVTGKMAELRNLYGTGHGKHPRAQSLQPRHARLAVGASAALVTFLYETHLARPKQADGE
jgi:hypothetical protein